MDSDDDEVAHCKVSKIYYRNFNYHTQVEIISRHEGTTVAERLARSPPTKANRGQSPAGSPDFRKWESYWTMPLVDGSSRGSPASSAHSFQRRSILTSITLIGSQDSAVKSRPNLFTHFRHECLRLPLPTKANRVQSPAGSLRIFASGNRTRRRVFSGISHSPRPFIPALLHTHLTLHSRGFKTSLSRAEKLYSELLKEEREREREKKKSKENIEIPFIEAEQRTRAGLGVRGPRDEASSGWRGDPGGWAKCREGSFVLAEEEGMRALDPRQKWAN
ncbi:hypothetical protein PR048_032196 [Dryococelus australis]|uniref:Uncharacterized protein n=1 Tax=Dryococelus australis TaxID=614101 RepID=A0ABQ9G4S8_9NEOP|nr:hypothetical protein PR048_032196 [Dryococelus australis]